MTKEKRKYTDRPWIDLRKPTTQQELTNRINRRKAYKNRVQNKDRKICRKCGKEFLSYNLNYCKDCVSLNNRKSGIKSRQSEKVKVKNNHESSLYIVYELPISQIMKIGETINMKKRYAGYKCKSEKNMGDKFIKYLIENDRDIEEFIVFVFDLSVIHSTSKANQKEIRKHIEYYLQTKISCVVDTRKKPNRYEEIRAKEWLSELIENSSQYDIKFDTYRSDKDSIKNSYLYKFFHGGLENFRFGNGDIK